MGKLKSTSAWFIADANVLIDYAETSPAILGQVVKHIGPVYVAADVLEEVDQLDEAQCKAIGLTVVDGNLAQLTEASQRGGQLPMNKSSLSSSKPKPACLSRSYAAAAASVSPLSTSGAPSSVAWKHQMLLDCEIWSPRTPSSRSYWPRPIWIFTRSRACSA